jgi:prepilin-type N-terminal cleavage/methylation domain-containing protein
MQATLERLRQRRDERADEGGFTLIELLIVIVILAILAAIVVFAVQNLTKQSAKASCQSDYKTVESALETFKAQTGAYPGGTFNSGTTVTAVATNAGPPVTIASNPNYVVPANEAGITFLLQSTDTDSTGTVIGPWLKDAPVNSSHYEIVVSSAAGGTGVVDVYKADGSGDITATPAHSIADCGSVQ